MSAITISDIQSHEDFLYLPPREQRYLLKQLMSSEAFAELIPEAMDAAIHTYFEPAVKGRTVVNVKRASSPIISWLERYGGLGAAILGENEEPPRITIRYGKKTVRPVFIGTSFELSDTLIEDVGIDIVNEHLREATRAIALKEDYYIFSTILNSVANDTATKRGVVWSSHIIDANDSDFSDNHLDHAKIQFAIQILEDEGFSPDVALMSPAQFTQLQMLTEFRDTNGTLVFVPSGDATEMITRGVRRAFGIPVAQVIVDRNVPNDVFMLFQKDSFVNFYELDPLTIRRQRNELIFSSTHVLRERVACAPSLPHAAVKIKNLYYEDLSKYLSS